MAAACNGDRQHDRHLLEAAPLGAGGGIFDTNGNNVIFATGERSGGLTKQGNGTLTLNGANTYTGPTTIAGARWSSTAAWRAASR